MQVKVARIENAFSLADLKNKAWAKAENILINKYWSGENAPDGRHAQTKLLWSDTALYVRFEANQAEPLVVSNAPNLKLKTIGLWDRDVCEIFIAPDFEKPNRYFEFEIAPTGEWIDLKIEKFSDRRETDFDYNSEMESAARIESGKITLAIKIPWRAFGKTPQPNDVWKGNLFRCVGSGATRGYLAWQPTRTERPNFHVPETFGEFEFVK